jgi:gas vesicle protein
MNDHSYVDDAARGTAGIAITGFVVGALFGAGVALLLAPASGDETRRKLGETARRLGNTASDKISSASEKIGAASEKIGDKISAASEKIGDKISSASEKIKEMGQGREREPLTGSRTPSNPGAAS